MTEYTSEGIEIVFGLVFFVTVVWAALPIPVWVKA